MIYQNFAFIFQINQGSLFLACLHLNGIFELLFNFILINLYLKKKTIDIQILHGLFV